MKSLEKSKRGKSKNFTKQNMQKYENKGDNSCIKCHYFVHAISGCDTTSQMFGIEKSTTFQKILLMTFVLRSLL